jgi:hypothetical protein
MVNSSIIPIRLFTKKNGNSTIQQSNNKFGNLYL